ncbi:type I-B CRISPR-associated protein Cas8b1/Cst1 [Crassaminicella thermophila]|uniref:Type I-B CRISPR-associated protein Cas8b1/Cst1 n=1 Tax=Crassaminicella thermophila TaxID=2599308 RepID=A0A5C0SBY4_CRATE|nr:type I-B CRISPR-associated protein Cas8b1/Cst1 [Crassaminicella thermophila]QEK11018.1 type I-B CRISPR-associated protein Cas8b1/Cst1 [Crassaminicella thermophila]
MKTINKIRLELADWLYNAGIVGVANILDANDVAYKRGINYIEFEETALENFEEKYFKYFIDKYKKFTSWYNIVKYEDVILNFKEENVDEEYLENINKQIDYVKEKLKSASYKSAYVIIQNKEKDLLKEEKQLNKIKKNKKQKVEDVLPNIKEQLNRMQQIIEYLKTDEVAKIILAKNIIYDIIAKFWSDVSFLNKNNNKKNMYEEYRIYFVDGTLQYIEKIIEKAKYKCFVCDRKISKLSKPVSYDLTWINKMGVDMSRKTSHFWDLSGDTFICPICNFVYSCIPAGFTVIKGQGLFINQNSSINNLIAVNKHALERNTTFEELEDASYFSIVENINQNKVEQLDKEIENIQIIKLDSTNVVRPYTFNILSKDKLKVMNGNKKMLQSMIKVKVKVGTKEYLNLYKEVVTRLYEGKNQFDLINQLFHLRLDKKFNKLHFIDMIIKINNNFIGGREKKKMVHHKVINDCKGFGLDLRISYVNKKAENKLNGISYRLLNALKTKNTSKFMDTLLNAYMYLNKQVPTIFIEGLKDTDKFQTLGYAFLLGLQGEEMKENKKDDIKEDMING